MVDTSAAVDTSSLLVEDDVQPRRLLLVDQNDDFLDGVCALLEKESALQVVGRAHSGAQALERALETSPDVILMDLSLPDMKAIRVLPWLKALRPAPFVLIMSFYGSRAVADIAAGAGADRCLLKAQVAGGLLPALQELR